MNLAASVVATIWVEIAAAVSPRIAAGLSCGPAIMPGIELVMATINCMARQPNSIIPIPAEANCDKSPE
jgi:hypothetical protein